MSTETGVNPFETKSKNTEQKSRNAPRIAAMEIYDPLPGRNLPNTRVITNAVKHNPGISQANSAPTICPRFT